MNTKQKTYLVNVINTSSKVIDMMSDKTILFYSMIALKKKFDFKWLIGSCISLLIISSLFSLNPKEFQYQEYDESQIESNLANEIFDIDSSDSTFTCLNHSKESYFITTFNVNRKKTYFLFLEDLSNQYINLPPPAIV